MARSLKHFQSLCIERSIASLFSSEVHDSLRSSWIFCASYHLTESQWAHKPFATSSFSNNIAYLKLHA